MLYENERSSRTEYLYHQSDENLTFQKHAHHSFELIFLLRGQMVCEVDEESYLLAEGDALLILPGQVHSYRTERTSESYLCVFSTDFVASFWQEMRGKRLSAPVFREEDAVSLAGILRGDGSLYAKKAVLYRLCAAAYEQSEICAAEEANYALASRIAFYVQENYTKDISLRQLARTQGYNYTYLSVFFNRTFGQNFSAYVNRFRLQHAAHLLAQTQGDITEIVSESGFSTIRNFNGAFKREYGMAPRDYRAMHATKTEEDRGA